MFSVFKEALKLIITLDPEVLKVCRVSIFVSFSSTALASIFGVPLGIFIASGKFKFKGTVISILNTLMALPMVVVGLFTYTLLYHQGILGKYNLLFTPCGIIIGQFIVCLPIITALTISAVENRYEEILNTSLTLGANNSQARFLVFREHLYEIMTAVIAGFGRVFGEVGVSMMVGGNIYNYTRTITTAVALETSKGEFVLGLALGLILMFIALVINLAVQMLKRINRRT